MYTKTSVSRKSGPKRAPKRNKAVSGLPSPITLFPGDCREVLPTLEENSIDLIITDPPYFLDGLDNGWHKGGNGTPKGTGAVGSLPVGMKFDTKQGERLQEFMEEVGEQMLTVAKPGAFAVVFSQPRLAPRMAMGLEIAGFEIRDMLVWQYRDKSQFKAFSLDHFVERMNISKKRKKELLESMGGRKTPQLRPQFESLVLAQKPKEGTHIDNWEVYQTGLIDSTEKLNGLSPSTLMYFEKPRKERYNHHLTVKPIKLLRHLIRLFSIPGQTILDPFLGSGSTAIAALQEGRFCTGIEIEREYLKIAKKRIKNYGEDEETIRPKDKSYLGELYLAEAVLDVLLAAYRNNECIGPAEISKRAGIFRDSGYAKKSGNDDLVWGILGKLVKQDRIVKCPQDPQKPDEVNGWKLTDKEYQARNNNVSDDLIIEIS